MGRRPSAVKNLEKSYTPENTNPSLEREDFPVKVFRVKLSPERIMEINPERSPIQERTNSQCEGGKKSAKSELKNPKYNKAAVRRSQRIQNALMHAPNLYIEPVSEQITLIETDKDEPTTDEENDLQEANLNGKSLEEKIDFILQRLEALQSKISEISGLDESSSASIKYRSMYLDSLKKNEALKDENHQLIVKLENALGKVEVFEKQYRFPIEVLEKMKETAVHASTEAMHNAFSLENVLELGVSAAKRKRNA